MFSRGGEWGREVLEERLDFLMVQGSGHVAMMTSSEAGAAAACFFALREVWRAMTGRLPLS